MKQFTDAGIKRLKVIGKRYHVTEGGGLYLIVNASGKKTWASYYRSADRKRRWHRHGDYPTYSLADARRMNIDLQKQAEVGHDTTNMTESLGLDPTLQQLFNLFIKKSVDRKGNPLREGTINGYKQAFEADILPYLGRHKVRDLRKRDIIAILEKVIDRGAHNQANQVYRRLRRVLAFAAARDIIEVSPMGSMEPVGQTQRRSRVLSNNEIKTFMEWSPKAPESGHVLKLILITGARPGEVAGITKEEIQGDWWTIPAERAKNGIPHRVFLTDLAKGHLPKKRFEIDPRVVAKCLRRALDINAKPPEKKKRGGQPNPLPISDFVPHDLRRTMATGLAALGFSDEVINAAQGRAKLGIIGTYNLHTYDEERQKAAQAWEKKLLTISLNKKEPKTPQANKQKQAEEQTHTDQLNLFL